MSARRPRATRHQSAERLDAFRDGIGDVLLGDDAVISDGRPRPPFLTTTAMLASRRA
jgi:hypothetical protein